MKRGRLSRAVDTMRLGHSLALMIWLVGGTKFWRNTKTDDQRVRINRESERERSRERSREREGEPFDWRFSSIVFGSTLGKAFVSGDRDSQDQDCWKSVEEENQTHSFRFDPTKTSRNRFDLI